MIVKMDEESAKMFRQAAINNEKADKEYAEKVKELEKINNERKRETDAAFNKHHKKLYIWEAVKKYELHHGYVFATSIDDAEEIVESKFKGEEMKINISEVDFSKNFTEQGMYIE